MDNLERSKRINIEIKCLKSVEQLKAATLSMDYSYFNKDMAEVSGINAECDGYGVLQNLSASEIGMHAGNIL